MPWKLPLASRNCRALLSRKSSSWRQGTIGGDIALSMFRARTRSKGNMASTSTSASTAEDINRQSPYRSMDDPPSHVHGDDRAGGAPRPRRPARSLSGALLARAGMAPPPHPRPVPAPCSTTPAQLRAATVRGGVHADEERDSIGRAQRETAGIRYHAREAVRAGNEVAADRVEGGCTPVPVPDLGPPDLAWSDSTVSGGWSSSSDGAGGTRAGAGVVVVGSRPVRTPWDALRSVGSALRRGGRGPDEAGGGDGGDGTGTLEGRVAVMRDAILRESHGRSGALLGATAPVLRPDPGARERVRLMVDEPGRADAYIRLGLRDDPGMEIGDMIRMIDYYCSQSSGS